MFEIHDALISCLLKSLELIEVLLIQLAFELRFFHEDEFIEQSIVVVVETHNCPSENSVAVDRATFQKPGRLNVRVRVELLVVLVKSLNSRVFVF